MPSLTAATDPGQGLLDTHALVWATTDPARLSTSVRAAIESASVKVSVVSLWELILKKHHPNTPVVDPVLWWERHVSRSGIEILSIRIPHLQELDVLPLLHRDPFDRLLIAQSRAEKLHLITADKIISQYNVPVLW